MRAACFAFERGGENVESGCPGGGRPTAECLPGVRLSTFRRIPGRQPGLRKVLMPQRKKQDSAKSPRPKTKSNRDAKSKPSSKLSANRAKTPTPKESADSRPGSTNKTRGAKKAQAPSSVSHRGAQLAEGLSLAERARFEQLKVKYGRTVAGLTEKIGQCRIELRKAPPALAQQIKAHLDELQSELEAAKKTKKLQLSGKELAEYRGLRERLRAEALGRDTVWKSSISGGTQPVDPEESNRRFIANLEAMEDAQELLHPEKLVSKIQKCIGKMTARWLAYVEGQTNEGHPWRIVYSEFIPLIEDFARFVRFGSPSPTWGGLVGELDEFGQLVAHCPELREGEGVQGLLQEQKKINNKIARLASDSSAYARQREQLLRIAAEVNASAAEAALDQQTFMKTYKGRVQLQAEALTRSLVQLRGRLSPEARVLRRGCDASGETDPVEAEKPGGGESPEDDGQLWDSLTNRQRYCLQALNELRAFDAEHRMRAVDIAEAAEGRRANVNTFKEPLGELVRRGLIESKAGREGGYWLTSEGRTLTEMHVGRNDDAAA